MNLVSPLLSSFFFSMLCKRAYGTIFPPAPLPRSAHLSLSGLGFSLLVCFVWLLLYGNVYISHMCGRGYGGFVLYERIQLTCSVHGRWLVRWGCRFLEDIRDVGEPTAGCTCTGNRRVYARVHAGAHSLPVPGAGHASAVAV